MTKTFTKPGISIIAGSSANKPALVEEELAVALTQLWDARFNLTPQQVERIIAITNEKYV